MGLRFGGNDVGSVMIEENVVRAAGVRNCTTEEELRRIIRDAVLSGTERYAVHEVFLELGVERGSRGVRGFGTKGGNHGFRGLHGSEDLCLAIFALSDPRGTVFDRG